MARMTEEEAFELSRRWTETTPKVGPNGSGFIAKRKAAAAAAGARMIVVDEFAADYLQIKASAEHKTPSDVLNDMIYEKLGVM